MLTAFGDGMLFALEMRDEDAAHRVLDFADAMVASTIPGVLVINLHSENAAQAQRLHAAMHELGRRDSLYWTMGKCLVWFSAQDEAVEKLRGNQPLLFGRFSALWQRHRGRRCEVGVT